jgi:hypothetical protein
MIALPPLADPDGRCRLTISIDGNRGRSRISVETKPPRGPLHCRRYYAVRQDLAG